MIQSLATTACWLASHIPLVALLPGSPARAREPVCVLFVWLTWQGSSLTRQRLDFSAGILAQSASFTFGRLIAGAATAPNPEVRAEVYVRGELEGATVSHPSGILDPLKSIRLDWGGSPPFRARENLRSHHREEGFASTQPPPPTKKVGKEPMHKHLKHIPSTAKSSRFHSPREMSRKWRAPWAHPVSPSPTTVGPPVRGLE